jgi:uncharacterized membrane protein
MATALAALEHNALAIWLRTSLAYPVLETLHIVGLASLFGSVLLVDMCLLRVIRRIDARTLARVALPWTLLGFLLAATAVHSSLKAPATVAILVPILALGVPVMDTLLVMAVRFLDRPKSALTARFLRMFHADRQHLHHLLSHFGGARSRIVAVIYAVVLSFCGLALFVAVTGETTLGVVLVVLEFTVILAMRRMGLAMEARRLARLQREEVKTAVLQAPAPRVASVRRMVR